MPEELLEKDAPPDDAFEGKLQIIFCSRTHSQLAQVLREIRRLPEDAVPQALTAVTLGARINLCINDSVRSRARGSGGHLNDLCRVATERGDAPGGCCLKKQADAMTDVVLTEMLDMEAMAQRGKATLGGGCPYYGARRAVSEADVLLVPYTSLVNPRTREKLGIKAAGNVFIFDEAHNLLEAINEANSVNIGILQARAAVDDLDAYAERYERRLSPGNAMRLRQLRQFCTLLHRRLATLEKASAHSVGGFLVSLGADHFDLAELNRFLEATELPRKVRGFSEASRVGGGPPRPGAFNAVYQVAEFLGALLGSTTEDRVLFQAPTLDVEAASVRYLSLDAEAPFRELIGAARTVIFAGGTLEPRAEFAPLYANVGAASLFRGGDPNVVHFAGRHVVPRDHIFARRVTHGPAGKQLDFRKDSRASTLQLSELRAILSTVAALTPGGAVFFFPSFEYLASVVIPCGPQIGGRQVFVESRRGADSCGDEEETGSSLLRSFAAAVRRDGGAVLLAVSGGKLSEGIDFKDELCRLVAVVGLPYPNASDLSLIEKMRFLDERRSKGAPGVSGREFYAARCMKGVNQCIGRAIRHAGDWAAVLLLDHRYAQPNIHSAISLWLREQASQATSFADTENALRSFFALRQQSVLANAVARVTTPAKTKLTDEQLARIARNREAAALKRRQNQLVHDVSEHLQADVSKTEAEAPVTEAAASA
eukprot:gnl/TRDRNA2_/TRDRNA2_170623_c0_seq1.p1 gnl/TRDRNA2_/TRDRNA2_170623_c0~~gnl/TRDRNA2_/TRDRNA2_170623_c0_seq1.p1  ORF type:complete len:711 (+),score=117.83 gnl/TRDRNA2_/TRDRNA2_170623_c0_seq1:559-2691(+)